MRRPFFFTLTVLFGISLDLFSKTWVFSRLPYGEHWELISGVVHIVKAKNAGVAFSMLSGRPALILSISVITIVALAFLYSQTWRSASASRILSLALLLAGAFGNLIDRVTLHYVRDFIDFVPTVPMIGHWAIFNLADVCITVGVALFVLSRLLEKPHA